ncbi:MAG TPA: MmcQ/YjbR family DNA-binding protein [Terriglobales bacterium]|nr:MmcQ/YjbR family DNA-binding protein [Terriglobales bacterium]
MTFESFRKLCLSMPGATEDVQWGNDLLFRIRGKIFASYNLEPPHGLTVKAGPERSAELLEIEGVERARYVGRYGWVTIGSFNALADGELRELIHSSYQLVAGKAPRPKAAAKAARPQARRSSKPRP